MTALENKTKEEIIAFQDNELKKLLHYLESHSPYYQKLFKEKNIAVSDIQTVEDLSKIPVTTKQDLQTRNWEFLCVDKSKVVEYCSTSGTLGKPVSICLTEKDLSRLAYNEYLSLCCAGGTPDDIYQLMVTLDRQFMAGLAYYSGIRKLGAGIVRTGPGNVMAQLDIIMQFQPTALIAVPSFVLDLIKLSNEKNIDLNQTSVRKIICIGENIRNEDFSLNELSRQILNQWHVQLFSTYASTEKQTAFTECTFGNGGHHQPELLIIELLDENNQKVKPGEYGELTITTLGVEGMPLLRYKTGDICTFNLEKCTCGRNTARISPIKGRKQQLIKYNGTTLYPQAVFNVLNSVAEIEDYVVEVSRSPLGTDDLQIKIAVATLSDALFNKIRQLFQSKLRVIPKITFLPANEIKRLQISESKRKVSKFLDFRS